MRSSKNITFAVTLQYNDAEIMTKANKISYVGNNILYKVALPAAISPINQCWFSKQGQLWELVMGQHIDPALANAVKTAIELYEKLEKLYPAAVGPRARELRSA